MKDLVEHYKKKGISSGDLKRLTLLSSENLDQFIEYAERRLNHEPMQYIEGFNIFYGRKFKVDRRVYISDKETELLVETVLNSAPDGSSVVDVGTGSGSLAISLKLENPTLAVYACELQPEALEVARENARDHGADIQFFRSSFVDSVDIPEPDIVMADLPYGNWDYVPLEHEREELKHMPSVAVFHPGGELAAYRGLIESVKKKGWRPTLFVETDVAKIEQVKDLVPDDCEWEQRVKKGGSTATIIYLGGRARIP